MIRSLRLLDFRCFESLALELPPEMAVFVGENAQGKTSLLEAVCVLVRLHSPRTHRMKQVVRFDRGNFGVAGQCWGEERRVSYGTEGYDLRVEGESAASQGDYLASGGLVVWMGNEDLGLVRGPGEGRRRFLDFAASQLGPTYRRHLSRYRRALRARNLLLKARRIDEGQVAAYTELLIEHGSALQDGRADLIARLATPVRETHALVSGRDEAITLSYRPAGGGDLATAFVEASERERRQGQTVVGPHRDDLVLALNGLPAADYASEGQQRTLALALKLGQGRVLQSHRAAPPVFLIDDVFGELDPGRRNALIGALPAEAQKLVTTTSLAWLEGHQPPVFRVRTGTVEG